MKNLVSSASSTTTVLDLLKTLIILVVLTGLVVALAFWMHKIVGIFVALTAAIVWTSSIAPVLAGQMVAALIVAGRRRGK